MILDPTQTRREFFAVTAMARLIDSSLKKAESDEVIPVVKNKEFWFFIVANFVTNYSLGCSSDVLNKGVHKFYTSWAGMTSNDKTLVDIWHRQMATGSPHW